MNNSGPLMFINNPDSLNKNELKTGKRDYDSRKERKDTEIRISKRDMNNMNNKEFQSKTNKKIEENILNTNNETEKELSNKFLLDKLKNICVLYSHDMPILCKISYNDKIIEGVPSYIDGNNLYIYVKGNQVIIDILEITDFKILEI